MNPARFFGSAVLAVALAQVTFAAPPVVTEFDEPFLFAYLSFEQKIGHEAGEVWITANDGKGGAGLALNADWSAYATHSPAIRIKLGPQNRATQIKFQVTDSAEGKRTFTYDLAAASADEFRQLLPVDSMALAGEGFDPKTVNAIHIQGDWRPAPVDVRVDRIDLVPATPEMLAAREEDAKKQRQREEQRLRAEAAKQRATEALLAEGAEHPADGPELVHIGMAAPLLLGIELQAGHIAPSAPQPYQPQAGDVLKPTGEQKLVWKGDQVVVAPMGQELHRQPDEKSRARKLGFVNEKAGTVWQQVRTGAELDLAAVDDPRAYRISIDGGDPVFPAAVYRKSKPNSVAQGSGDIIAQHFLYLKLAEPLPENATVRVEFFALNTREPAAEFHFTPTTQRSEAIHVSYLGFRGDDPFKRAYLSLWAGTGGGQSFPQTEFQLLDPSGNPVFTGAIQLGMPADQPEAFREAKNHSQTNVYHLDFSDFTAPGTYTVHVPGLGVSYPFEIGRRTWEKAFAVSMHGFLSHRSGIELGPPFTDYVRPRNMHPEDEGFVVFKTDVTLWDGESGAIAASFKRLLGPDLDPSTLEIHPDAWGGYMDAGDWDRRSQHLICSLRHLELLDLFPDVFGQLKLALPPAEAENDLPDLLDEVLWNVDFYRRLQEADGGVGGGVESTGHPRPAEASWQETLLVGVFRPDPETSYRYAGVAAKTARILGSHSRATVFRDSAVRAWDWAEQNAAAEIAAALQRNAPKAKSAADAVAKMRALAAAELFRLTREPGFHAAFLEAEPSVLHEADIAMSYALIPAADSDPAMREKAVAAIVAAADAALDISAKNGFNLAPFTTYLPMMGYTCIWSTPGATAPPVLPRAHFLTGDGRYLAGAIAACQYPGGANPMNMSYTTGIGERTPLAPLHIDYRISGQLPPAGITVYGQSDPSLGYGFDSFAHTWFLNRYGGVPSQQWPTAEAYIDLGNWPAMNEYTVHQSFSPTSYHWGYLAGRAERP